MTRLAYATPLVVLALLSAGCANRGPERSASTAINPVEQSYRAGTGVVQAVTPAPGPIAAGPQTGTPQASAPSTPSPSGMQRLRIRMDDGRMMWVDTSSRDFQAGQRVQLSANNEIQRQ